MSTLIVQIPPRPRLNARSAEPLAQRPPLEYNFVQSPDGRTVGLHGRSAAALLPRSRTTVLVADAADVSWRRIDLPKAPAARMRAALVGVVEESLLEDDADVQLAVEPRARPGGRAWITAASRSWLALHLDALGKAGHYVDRIAPAFAPVAAEGTPLAHASAAIDPMTSAPTDEARVVFADADGVASVPLAAAAALAGDDDEGRAWSAAPSIAIDAERLSGRAVTVLSDADALLRSAEGEWNLRQFDLAPRQRGTRAVRSAWGRFLGPDWAPVRYGLATFAVLHLVGLNIVAWEERRAVDQQRAAVSQVLRDTFPQVRAIQDAPVQMGKEVDVLRAAAGRPGDADLEPLLHAAESAWPPTRGPVDSLKFEPGRLTLSAAGWTPQEVERFRTQLKAAGVAVEAAAGRLTLSKPAPGKRV